MLVRVDHVHALVEADLVEDHQRDLLQGHQGALLEDHPEGLQPDHLEDLVLDLQGDHLADPQGGLPGDLQGDHQEGHPGGHPADLQGDLHKDLADRQAVTHAKEAGVVLDLAAEFMNLKTLNPLRHIQTRYSLREQQ